MANAEFSIDDSRSEKRFLLEQTIRGTFGAASVTFIDIGASGAQVEHSTPLKLGTSGRLTINLPPPSDQVKVTGLVVWSRLSRTPNSEGKYLYRSGLRIDEDLPMREAVDILVAASIARPDLRSLDKKRRVLEEKEKRKQQPMFKAMFHKAPQIPTDQVLLILQARERLALQPDESVKWYNRAKFSFIEAGQDIHYRDEILAIWEYLERTIDLGVISRVVDEKR